MDIDKKDEAIVLSPYQRDFIARVRAAGSALHTQGNKVGRYFASLDTAGVKTQRDTKDNLAARLKASSTTPQIVTVQGRNGERARAYMIIPIEMAIETLELQTSAPSKFIPITARLRGIDNGVTPPALKPRSTGRTRSKKPGLPRIAGSTAI